MKSLLLIFSIITFTPEKNVRNMDLTEKDFWDIINHSRHEKDYIFEKNIISKLELMSDKDVIRFEEILVHKVRDLYTWDAYGVLVLLEIEPNMPEQFWDFRAWVIGQGKEFYDTFKHNPEKVAEHIVKARKEKIYLDFMELFSVAYIVMKSRNKENKSPKEIVGLSFDLKELSGNKWHNETELKKRFPTLNRAVDMYRASRE